MFWESPQAPRSRKPPHTACHARKPLVLPSHAVENDFEAKVLEKVRRRRRSRSRELEAEAANTVEALLSQRRQLAPLRPDTSPLRPDTARVQSARPAQRPTSAFRPSSAVRPYTVPNKDPSPKYLATSLVPHIPPTKPSRRNPRLGRLNPVDSVSSIASARGHTRKSLIDPDQIRRVLQEEMPNPPRIVENHSSCNATTKDGVAEIPARTWLVLEGAGLHGICLSLGAGGGYIPDDSKVLLLPVAEHRLHAKAAEANFQRASRGKSIVALRHAGYILELLQDREKDAPPTPLPTPNTSCASFASEETMARTLRMEKVVELFAVAAQQRSLAPVSSRRKSEELDEEPVGVHRGKNTQLKGAKAMREFLEFSRHRFGNPIRAWWHLDVEENMKVGEMLFKRRCLEIGFSGNVQALWYYADSDKSGAVSIFEIHPKSAMILASFKRFIEDKFRGNVDVAFKAIDENGSGRICKDEFCREVRIRGFIGNAPMLFELLDRVGLGYVVEPDVRYLSKWLPRPYLMAVPDFEGFEKLKEALFQLHGAPLFKSWRRWLDRDGTMRVSWEEFIEACRGTLKEHKELSEYMPRTPDQAARVWRAIDVDCSGYITLREFDQSSYDSISKFKRWCERNFGTVLKAYHSLDNDRNGRVTISEMRKITRRDLETEPYPGNTRFLFDCLDVNSLGRLAPEDVRWLDSWDLAFDEWEAKLTSRTATTSETQIEPQIPAHALSRPSLGPNARWF